MQALITGGDGTPEKQESLIVSWGSLERRKNDYEELITKTIPQNTQEISIAREHGDLRENFEFKAAKDQQRVLMRRKAEMERELSLARGTDFANPDLTAVSLGTTVSLKDVATGKKTTYSILGAWDSDPDQGAISYQAGIAQALLGHKVGETVTVPGEGTDDTVEILEIKLCEKLPDPPKG
jgi:transcription elongation GreA/GreB family factor